MSDPLKVREPETIRSLLGVRDSLYARYFELRHGRAFGQFGVGARVFFPRVIYNPAQILIGSNVEILHGAFLAATGQTGESTATLEIGAGTKLGASNHIYATKRIVLGSEVLTAGNVYIADNTHSFSQVGTPILRQPVLQLKAVSIGNGAWIGANAAIIGASIGAGAVVGAGAIVTSDVPDHCVVVGAPARIVKRFDAASGSWVRVE